MQTKWVPVSIAIMTIFAVVLLMSYSIVEKLRLSSEVRVKVQSIPSAVTLFNADSTRFVFPKDKSVILVLFNSACEYCQYEFAEINASISSFSDVELVFLSSEPISAIKKVALPFESHRNVNFVKINPEDVFANFGTVRYPTILIYGTNGKLIKEFKGETKVEAILKYARQ